MKEEGELTAFELAWREALATTEKEQPNVSGELSANTDHLDSTGKLPAFRKPTIHIAPQGVQKEEISKRVDESKLIYQARKLGSSWSKWINEARLVSWRSLDPRMVSAWTSLATQMSDTGQPVKLKLFSELAGGMGIAEDYVRKGLVSNDNKISYMFEGNNEERRHLIIGVNRLSINSNVPSGAFFLASIAHLSEFRVGDNALRLLKSSLNEQLEIGGQLSLQDTYGVTSIWVAKPEVKEYFIQKNSR